MFKSKEQLRRCLVLINLVSIISTVSHGPHASTNTSKDVEQIKCWNCSRSISPDDHFCPYCKAIQRPNLKRTYFDVFKLEPSFTILEKLKDSVKLQKKFILLQNRIHPETYENRSQMEYDIASEHYDHLRRAYLHLQDPIKRGIYLLSLHNITLADNVTATNKTISPPNRIWLKKYAHTYDRLVDALKINHFEKVKETIRVARAKLLKRLNVLFRQKRFQQAKEYVIILRDFTNMKYLMVKKRKMFDDYEEHSHNWIIVEPEDEEAFFNDTKVYEYIKDHFKTVF